MIVFDHSVSFNRQFEVRRHCVGEDSDAVARHISLILKNPSRRCRTGLNTLRLRRFLGLKPQAAFLRRSAAKTNRIAASLDDIFRSSCDSTARTDSRAADKNNDHTRPQPQRTADRLNQTPPGIKRPILETPWRPESHNRNSNRTSGERGG